MSGPGVWLFLLAACGPGDQDWCGSGEESVQDTEVQGSPSLTAPNPQVAPLAWRFSLAASGPVCVAVTVDDGTGERSLSSDGAHSEHTLPVLGLRADRDVLATWTAWDTGGAQLGTGDVSFTTPALPERFPRFEILAHDPTRQEPGHVLLDLKTPKYRAGDDDDEVPEVAAYAVVLDEALEVIWWLDTGDKIGDVMLTPDQHLVGLTGGNVVVWDWFGEVQGTWRSNADAVNPVAVDARDFHHEVVPLPDGGFWTLSFEETTVPAYPTGYADPTVLGGEALIDDSVALRFQADGSVTARWRMSERLDTTRIGYDSLDKLNKERFDWAHANGLALDPADGGLLVSLRHQDAVVKLSAEGDLVWILASPTGWSDAFTPYLLAPVGDLDWPYHQHAPALAADGTLLVFDNGTRRHNPYEAEGAEWVDESRVVAYRIDADAGTVDQVWEYVDTLTGPLYASALSGADPLPETGNVLASFGFLEEEGGVPNEDAGRGTRTVRLIQVHPDALDDPVFDLRLYADAGDESVGWKSYRAEPMPRLQDLVH